MAVKIKEIRLKDFDFEPSSYRFGEEEYPGVSRHGDGYQIRIQVSNFLRGNSHKMTWDYFYLDATGLIVKSPRGYSKAYNGKVRVIDIAQEESYYATKEFIDGHNIEKE
jgi:hypothetical protein